MSAVPIVYLPERPEHDPAIEAINAEAFGPGRFTRAAHKIREGGPHDPELSFVAEADKEIVGSVRQSWIVAGGVRAVLLGPLAVRPHWKNKGIGKQLVRIALEAAKKRGAPMVILVGDAPYYEPLGFRMLRETALRMPWPVDPSRLLIAAFDEEAVGRLSGVARHAACFSGPRDTTSRQVPAEAPQVRENRRTAAGG